MGKVQKVQEAREQISLLSSRSIDLINGLLDSSEQFSRDSGIVRSRASFTNAEEKNASFDISRNHVRIENTKAFISAARDKETGHVGSIRTGGPAVSVRNLMRTANNIIAKGVNPDDFKTYGPELTVPKVDNEEKPKQKIGFEFQDAAQELYKDIMQLPEVENLREGAKLKTRYNAIDFAYARLEIDSDKTVSITQSVGSSLKERKMTLSADGAGDVMIENTFNIKDREAVVRGLSHTLGHDGLDFNKVAVSIGGAAIASAGTKTDHLYGVLGYGHRKDVTTAARENTMEAREILDLTPSLDELDM